MLSGYPHDFILFYIPFCFVIMLLSEIKKRGPLGPRTAMVVLLSAIDDQDRKKGES